MLLPADVQSDVELSPDWLELLVAELERDPKVGFVTGKIMRYDDRDVIEQAGHDFFTCGHFEPRGLDRRQISEIRRLSWSDLSGRVTIPVCSSSPAATAIAGTKVTPRPLSTICTKV